MKLGVFFAMEAKVYPKSPFDYLEEHKIDYKKI